MKTQTPPLNTIGQRVRFLRKLRGEDIPGGLSQKKLADRISARGFKVAQASINQLEHDEMQRPRYLNELAAELGTTTDWILHGKGPRDVAAQEDYPPPVVPAYPQDVRPLGFGEPENVSFRTDKTIEIEGDRYAAIPRYDMRASAGGGSLLPANPEIKNRALFRLEWIRRVTTSPLDKLALMEVAGDSMEPTLRQGDNVLVDTLQTQPRRRDGIYVLNRDGELQVKRVAAHPVSGLLTIRSDNQTYPTWPDIPPDQVDIVGRVVWAARVF